MIPTKHINSCTVDLHKNKNSKLNTICMHCNNVKINNSTWINMYEEIRDIHPSDISHGICPECAVRYYSNIL